MVSRSGHGKGYLARRKNVGLFGSPSPRLAISAVAGLLYLAEYTRLECGKTIYFNWMINSRYNIANVIQIGQVSAVTVESKLPRSYGL